jgi:hypothetical protein
MKAPGILEGIVIAIGASVAGGVLSALLPMFISRSNSMLILIAALTLAYLLYLLKRSNERTGRVIMVALWLITTLGSVLLDTSLISFLLIQAALIWMVRSLYFHSSVLPALLDLGLVAFGLVASSWAILQTGSVMTAVWVFFLSQCLFVLIPSFAASHNPSSCLNTVETDRFQSAHRVALDAVRKLSTHT